MKIELRGLPAMRRAFKRQDDLTAFPKISNCTLGSHEIFDSDVYLTCTLRGSFVRVIPTVVFSITHPTQLDTFCVVTPELTQFTLHTTSV